MNKFKKTVIFLIIIIMLISSISYASDLQTVKTEYNNISVKKLLSILGINTIKLPLDKFEDVQAISPQINIYLNDGTDQNIMEPSRIIKQGDIIIESSVMDFDNSYLVFVIGFRETVLSDKNELYFYWEVERQKATSGIGGITYNIDDFLDKDIWFSHDVSKEINIVYNKPISLYQIIGTNNKISLVPNLKEKIREHKLVIDFTVTFLKNVDEKK